MDEGFQSFYHSILNEEIESVFPEELLERYEAASCLAYGKDSEIYLLTRRKDGAKAILRASKAGAGEDALAEYQILKELNHPGVPKAMDVYERGGKGYLVREYIEGQTLKQYVKEVGPLGEATLIGIAAGLCDILAYLHGQTPPVIHRDIKPENIVIDPEGRARLIDFGIARAYREHATSDTVAIGTRPYMAPEQFGGAQTDGRADLYALGVAMIFMATGQSGKQYLTGSFPYKDLVPIIKKCIKTDSDQRFQSAERLKRRLLWLRGRVARKIAIGAGACAAALALFALGLFIGQGQGFQRGVDAVMDVPIEKNRPFSMDELYQPLTFESWYIDMAVRTALNKQPEDTIYRTEVTGRMGELQIFGTYILHPSLGDTLLKAHQGKGTVTYSTSNGFWIDTRGDISSLADIPNMYYLRTLTLTSQSIADLSPLSGMKLESINLTDNFIGNLLPLKDMVTLRVLDVCQNPLRDLTPISRLLSLEFLDISQTQVTDIRPLAELTKLETLLLGYCDIRDISVLARLPHLREVDVSYTLVGDLSPLLRPDNPIAVRCVGLPKEVVDRVRDEAGIVIVEE